jgi:hypothetical protein
MTKFRLPHRSGSEALTHEGIIRSAGIIRVLCISEYAPPMRYIRVLPHKGGAIRHVNFREYLFYALR